MVDIVKPHGMTAELQAALTDFLREQSALRGCRLLVTTNLASKIVPEVLDQPLFTLWVKRGLWKTEIGRIKVYPGTVLNADISRVDPASPVTLWGVKGFDVPTHVDAPLGQTAELIGKIREVLTTSFDHGAFGSQVGKVTTEGRQHLQFDQCASAIAKTVKQFGADRGVILRCEAVNFCANYYAGDKPTITVAEVVKGGFGLPVVNNDFAIYVVPTSGGDIEAQIDTARFVRMDVSRTRTEQARDIVSVTAATPELLAEKVGAALGDSDMFRGKRAPLQRARPTALMA